MTSEGEENRSGGLECEPKRTGEKMGWTGGLFGGFAWLLALAAVRFAQGHPVQAVIGALLFTLGMALVILLAPWRHPTTRYFLLLLPIYAVFLCGVAWTIWTFGGFEQGGIQVWNLFWIVPCLTPLGSIGWQRWQK